jgi:cytoskeleton protein RodZ
MATLGQELRRERELRGISLQEIADSTRISLRFLQAIEEDRVDCLPGGFFVRAILRSYAMSIGIDEHQVLNRYQEMQTLEEQHLDREEDTSAPKPQRSPIISRRQVRLAAAAIAFIGLGLVLLYVFSLPRGKTLPTLQETQLPASFPVVFPDSAEAVAEIQGLRLRLDFNEETWLHVYADGESVWDGIKALGQSLEITAEREVLLYVGNAGGFSLTINQQKAKPLGPRGAVRQDIRITSENYRDFLAAEEINKS